MLNYSFLFPVFWISDYSMVFLFGAILMIMVWLAVCLCLCPIYIRMCRCIWNGKKNLYHFAGKNWIWIISTSKFSFFFIFCSLLIHHRSIPDSFLAGCVQIVVHDVHSFTQHLFVYYYLLPTNILTGWRLVIFNFAFNMFSIEKIEQNFL